MERSSTRRPLAGGGAFHEGPAERGTCRRWRAGPPRPGRPSCGPRSRGRTARRPSPAPPPRQPQGSAAASTLPFADFGRGGVGGLKLGDLLVHLGPHVVERFPLEHRPRPPCREIFCACLSAGKLRRHAVEQAGLRASRRPRQSAALLLGHLHLVPHVQHLVGARRPRASPNTWGWRRIDLRVHVAAHVVDGELAGIGGDLRLAAPPASSTSPSSSRMMRARRAASMASTAS